MLGGESITANSMKDARALAAVLGQVACLITGR